MPTDRRRAAAGAGSETGSDGGDAVWAALEQAVIGKIINLLLRS